MLARDGLGGSRVETLPEVDLENGLWTDQHTHDVTAVQADRSPNNIDHYNSCERCWKKRWHIAVEESK